ncbi:MAG: hypothetical protein M2R45_03326 [Verrucomicrobia subdivision 3 bacterium]|nr:hypothetical protein [Limisphaerales bacterium]MCS1415394.1 hypothetical protein [Limisphaerales bacterium]
MKKSLSRRQFVNFSGSLAAAATLTPSILHAMSPFSRPGKPRLSTSIAAYSFREYFVDSTRRRQEIISEQHISLFDFIDYCADQGCAGTELTGYYFPKGIDGNFLLRIKRHAFLRGVAISGTAVGNTFTHAPGEKRAEQLAYVNRWIDHASIMGAPHLRVFAGNQGNQPFETAKKHCIEGLQECGKYAAKKGVFLGIENHGGIVAEADPLISIVQAVDNPWVGINLDTGNFHTDDVYGDIAKCAPYAVNVQLKVEVRPRGQKRKSKADLGRLIRILKNANYQGYVALEHEAAEDPWKTIPVYLAELDRLIQG